MKKTVIKKILLMLLIAVVVSPVLTACNRGYTGNLTTYTIDASLDTETMALSADMKVDYVNNGESILNELKFHLYPNAYREGATHSPIDAEQFLDAYRNGESYGGITVSNVKVDGVETTAEVGGADDNILTIPLSAPLEPSARTGVSMHFTVTIPNVRHRLGHYDGVVNLGNWYPIACAVGADGFYTDPYYDRGDPFFSECATYNVTLKVPKDMIAATTGFSTVKEEGGLSVYTVTQKNVRDFAASVGAFTKLSYVTSGIEVIYYYRKDEAPNVSLMAAVDSLKTFSHLFGEYPYDSYSVVETHFLQGGMEYPTIVYVSDELPRESYMDAIIHETAHQWWYGVVGNNQITNAWLDEGLADFSTTMFYERNTDYNVDAQKRKANTLSAYILYYDSGLNRGKDTSMTRALPEYATQFEYAFLNYAKAELMLESVRLTVGEDALLTGLKNYYKNMSFGIAQPDDLIGALETASGRRLKAVFDSWLDGNVMIFGGENTTVDAAA